MVFGWELEVCDWERLRGIEEKDGEKLKMMRLREKDWAKAQSKALECYFLNGLKPHSY